MKRILRNSLTFVIFSPMILFIHLTSIFIGRERAFRKWAPRITSTAKKAVELWIPRIASARHFDQLSVRMKSRLRFWKLVWDIEIKEDTNDILKLHISNCPVCEIFACVGLSKLSPSACQGDWAYAAENRDKWTFERKHQIVTGDRFCDHTYKRLK